MKKIPFLLLLSSFLLLFFSLLVACTGNPETQDMSEIKSDSLKDIEAIRSLIRKEVAAVNDGNPQAFYDILHNDVEIILWNSPSVRGEEAKKWIAGFMSGYNVKIDGYTNEEIEVDGELAYHRYSYDWTLISKASGDSSSAKGAGLHILKRNGDGTWLMLKDIWHPQEPVTE